MYAWSIRSLACRMQYFGIQFTDAVEKEIPSPGKLLDYGAMHKKIQEVHGLNVLRNLVH